MGDILNPYTVSPPPAPSSSNKSDMLMLYCGLIVVGIAAIALVLYNIIVIKRRNRHLMQESVQPEGPNGMVEVIVASNMSSENSLSCFKYTKEAGKEEQEGGGDDYECPVCLSVFDEGEEVRKLPRCKHPFHVECIDMWLYSHFDCPVCRTPVGPYCGVSV